MKRLFLIMLAVSSAALIAMPDQESADEERYCLVNEKGDIQAKGASLKRLKMFAEDMLKLQIYTIQKCSALQTSKPAVNQCMFALYDGENRIYAASPDIERLNRIKDQSTSPNQKSGFLRNPMVCSMPSLFAAADKMLCLCDQKGDALLLSPQPQLLARVAKDEQLKEYHLVKGISCDKVGQKIQAARQSAAAH